MEIDIQDILNGKYIIKIGYDKNNQPIYLGDTIVEEQSYEYSDDYWNGYDSKARYVYPSEVEKRQCYGKVYRKIEFNGICFSANRIKVEGDLPKGTTYSEDIGQEFLSKCYKL